MKARAISFVSVVAAVLVMGGTAYAGTICIDEAGFCNDMKLVWFGGEGAILDLTGYEYGCGMTDRIVSGSAHVAGSTVHIGLTGSFNSAAAPNPTLMTKNYTLDLTTMTGTGAYAYQNTAYWNGTSTITAAGCAPTALAVDGADSASQ